MCEVNDISPLLLFFLLSQEVKGNYCWPEREAGGGRARLLHHSPCPEKLSSFLLGSSLLYMVRRSGWGLQIIMQLEHHAYIAILLTAFFRLPK